VNKAGKRFVNEMERRDVVSRAEIATGMKPTFTIFNEKMIPRMGTKEEVEAGVARGRFVRADTLAELAGKLGIPAAALQACHGPQDQLAARSRPQDFPKRNPHDSHLGEIACTVCHHAHAESKVYCLDCHRNFVMKIPRGGAVINWLSVAIYMRGL